VTDAQAASDDFAARLRTDVPHSARIWNYWLGGKVDDGAATSDERLQATVEHNEGGHAVYVNRRPEEIAAYFDGLELLDPGVVPVSRWRPDHLWGGGQPPAVNAYGGVARKP
jgi:hypothetical protein